MKLPMSFTPLSLSEVHRRRATRSQSLVRPEVLTTPECTENEEDEEQP